MKILIANKFFFRNGGSEVVMFQERDHLLQTGHQVVDFSMQDARNFHSEFAVHFVGRQNYRDKEGMLGKLGSALSLIHSREAVRKITGLIKSTRPDVVHCHNIYHQLTPSIIDAAKRLGVPVVLTLHDYKPVCPTYNRLRQGVPCSDCLDGDFSQVVRHRCADGSMGKSALLYAEASVQRWMGNYEKVDAYIAPSRFMRKAVSHRIPESRVHLLYNGVDTSAIKADREEGEYVLYLGRLSTEKGVETLLRAQAASSMDWPLVIAGTGPLESRLRGQYSQARFAGHVTGAELLSTINKAAVVVVPSEWYENCPMSVLEAMAHGKPVVASCIGGIPELVRDGVTGLLYEAGNVDALRTRLDYLMGDVELRRSMGVAARECAEREFSLAAHNAGLFEIYRNVQG